MLLFLLIGLGNKLPKRCKCKMAVYYAQGLYEPGVQMGHKGATVCGMISGVSAERLEAEGQNLKVVSRMSGGKCS